MPHSRLSAAFRRIFKRKVYPILCKDCKIKVNRIFGLGMKIKSALRRRKGRKSRHKSKSHHLGKGIHHVKIRGKSRKVKVLSSGQWRFMKGR